MKTWYLYISKRISILSVAIEYKESIYELVINHSNFYDTLEICIKKSINLPDLKFKPGKISSTIMKQKYCWKLL